MKELLEGWRKVLDEGMGDLPGDTVTEQNVDSIALGVFLGLMAYQFGVPIAARILSHLDTEVRKYFRKQAREASSRLYETVIESLKNDSEYMSMLEEYNRIQEEVADIPKGMRDVKGETTLKDLRAKRKSMAAQLSSTLDQKIKSIVDATDMDDKQTIRKHGSYHTTHQDIKKKARTLGDI